MEKPEIGHVTGQVANEINNLAPVTFVAHYGSPPPQPSPTVQALRDFMPQASHESLDWLMHHAHFSARELLLACRMGGLVAPRGVLRQSRIAVVDTVWSLTCIVILVALVLASGLLMGSALSMSQRLTLVGVTTAMLVTMVGVLSIGVWPHVTARKAVRALERRARESITDDV